MLKYINLALYISGYCDHFFLTDHNLLKEQRHLFTITSSSFPSYSLLIKMLETCPHSVSTILVSAHTSINTCLTPGLLCKKIMHRQHDFKPLIQEKTHTTTSNY